MESEAALHSLNHAHGGLLLFLAVPGGARNCSLKNVSDLVCTMEGHSCIQAAMFLLPVSLRTVPTLKLTYMLWTDLAMNIAY